MKKFLTLSLTTISAMGGIPAFASKIYCQGPEVATERPHCPAEPMKIFLNDTRQTYIRLAHYDVALMPCRWAYPDNVLSDAFAVKRVGAQNEAYRLYAGTYKTPPANGSLSPTYSAYGELQFTDAGAIYLDYEDGTSTPLNCRRTDIPEGRASP